VPHKKSILLLSALLLLQACAYFNTFYNAQEIFSAAEELYILEESKNNLPRQLSQDYDRASVKALKVIDSYPESRWVDDAMFIYGVSNFRLMKFLAAQKMFRRLTIEYPNSPHYAESMLYIARCSYANNEKKLAFSMLESFTENMENAAFFGDAMMLYAQLAMEEGDTAKADEAYLKAIELIEDKGRRAFIHYDYAGQLIASDRIDEALPHLQQVEQFSLDPDLLGKVQLQYAKIYRLQKNYTASESLIKEMLVDEKYKNITGDLELELAEIYRNLGDYDRAVERNKTVIESYGNTRLASIAAFRIAELYLYTIGDLDKAREYYQTSIRQDKTSFEAAESRNAIRIIAQFTGQKSKLMQFERRTPQLKEDPLAYYSSLRDSAAVDSAAAVELENYIQSAEGYIEELLNQAELLSFTFSLYDSSLQLYSMIEEQFPFTASKAQILYSKAWIYETAKGDSLRSDSLRSQVVRDFPDSRFSRYITGAVDSTALKRQKDQDMIYQLEKRIAAAASPDTVIAAFQKIIPQLVDSLSLAQAWHYTAWIYDNYSENLDSALHYYQVVADRFGSSPYAETSRSRIMELTAVINESLQDSLGEFQETGAPGPDDAEDGKQ